MDKHTLYELLEYTKRVVALNFPESIWVSCEISQVKDSRGNLYLDLIEKDADTGALKAQVSAAIWYKNHLFIKKKLGELAPVILEPGRKVLVRVRIDFNEVYGLKLLIEDVDPSYTVGVMEMERKKTIEKLKKQGYIDRNGLIPQPLVPQRIAIISSESAAGYVDFIQQLTENEYGYRYTYDLYHVAVQGRNMEREIVEAFQQIKDRKDRYDAVVMIRGGGSKLDLSGFDNYNICAAIAMCELPVWTGIGHDIDDTLADMVAHTAYKTPTAVATAMVEHCLSYEMSIANMYMRAQTVSNRVLKEHELHLDRLAQNIKTHTRTRLQNHERDVKELYLRTENAVQKTIDRHENALSYIDRLLSTMSPEHILSRGFAYIRSYKPGSDAIQVGQEIQIVTETHNISAEVNNIEIKEQ